MQIKKSIIISITSVKGGVGKTTNILNLAGIYSNMKKKTLIIDLDLFSGDIAAILNLDYNKDIYNLFEDLNNNNYSGLDNYITKYNEYIDCLCAPKDPRFANKINSKIINLILSKTTNIYDIILIDTNHFLNSINLTAFDKSNEIVYIINNNLMNLKSMKSMVSIFDNMKKDNYKILMYNANNKNKEVYSRMDIKNVIKHDIDYEISNNFYIKNIDNYIIKGEIITLNSIMNRYNKTNNIYKIMADDFLRQVTYEE